MNMLLSINENKSAVTLGSEEEVAEVEETKEKPAEKPQKNSSGWVAKWVDSISRNIVISAESNWFYVWKVAVMCMSIYSTILYAFFATFRHDVDFHSYDTYLAHLEKDQTMFLFSHNQITMYD